MARPEYFTDSGNGSRWVNYSNVSLRARLRRNSVEPGIRRACMGTYIHMFTLTNDFLRLDETVMLER
ncbi:hypothetical protein GQ457_17G013060 [Hibiscus cannabinus]